MKIVIAPDSFKESLPAPEVAQAIAAGFRQVFPHAEYVCLPIADGGEGTVGALVAASAGTVVRVAACGPLGEAVDAFFGLSGDGHTAIIEMAAASGLAHVPPERRNPLLTTSRGTGELIRAALDAQADHLILGIGGSASNDGGAGMLQALGLRLLDAQDKEIAAGGGALAQLARIDASALDPRLSGCRIEVACDVDNPLTGPLGASAVFGPQKGATAAMVKQLDANLSHLATIIERDLGVSVATHAGAGAAGGMGAAMLALFPDCLRPGADIVIEALQLETHLLNADLVITGEGRMDAQTIHGKAPIGVARLARRHHKPVIAIAGSLGPGAAQVREHGIAALFSVVTHPCSLEEAMQDAAAKVEEAARNIAASVRIGQHLATDAALITRECRSDPRS